MISTPPVTLGIQHPTKPWHSKPNVSPVLGLRRRPLRFGGTEYRLHGFAVASNAGARSRPGDDVYEQSCARTDLWWCVRPALLGRDRAGLRALGEALSPSISLPWRSPPNAYWKIGRPSDNLPRGKPDGAGTVTPALPRLRGSPAGGPVRRRLDDHEEAKLVNYVAIDPTSNPKRRRHAEKPGGVLSVLRPGPPGRHARVLGAATPPGKVRRTTVLESGRRTRHGRAAARRGAT